MKNIFNLNLIAMLILIMMFWGCSGAQTEEKQIRVTMENWKQAILDQDIDKIVACYSENFKSMDGNGKEGARQMWEEIKELGYLDNLEINLKTANVEINGNTAEILIYNDEGEVEMDFSLEKEENNIWHITGIPSEKCSYETYTQPYGDDCVLHEEYYRCWDIYVPDGLSENVPLVIDLHGWTDTPSIQRIRSGFEDLAKSEGFFVVWPYGLCNSWNSGESCCPPSSADKIDDVGFIRKMIKQLIDEYNIDSDRIYVTGLSNGCSMTQRLANEASDIIAAAACMSLHLLVPKDPDYEPIPVMTLLGTKDDLYYPGEDMPGALQNFDTWKKMNNCTGEYVVTWSCGNSVAWTYQDCDNDTEVTLVTIDGGGHVLYKGKDTEINTTSLAWEFMKRFSK